MTSRSWVSHGILSTRVIREGIVMALLVDVETLVVTALQTPAGKTGVKFEDRVQQVMVHHAHQIVGTGKHLTDAIRIAEEYIDRWQSKMSESCACGEIGDPP